MLKITFLSTLFLLVLPIRSVLVAQCPPLYTFTGEAAGKYHGHSVAGAGDVNNDGYDDIIIGEAPVTVYAMDPGKVYVYSGKDGSLLYTFVGEAPQNQFGSSVAGAGDVNNDGYDDVIIGARIYQRSGVFGRGRAYVFSGIDGDTLYVFTGEGTVDHFGGSVSGAGDVNNDGFADLVIGANTNWAGGAYAGRAYVYCGKTGDLLYTFTGDAANDNLGVSVSGAGDVNNDSYDDVIVGVPGDDSGGWNAGLAYVFSGFDGAILHIFTGSVDERFGSSVSGSEDINGDGYADLIIGAPQFQETKTGHTYIFSGKDGSLLYTFTGEEAGDKFGRWVAMTGDVDGDSFSDLIVGAYLNNTMGVDAGQAYLFSGKTGCMLWTITGEAAGDFLGWGVASAGDVNNDGLDDVVIGAQLNDEGGIDAGKAYVYSVVNQTDVTGTVSSASVGLLGVPVDLYDSDNIVVSSIVTGELGEYQFTSLTDGDYTVSISTPLGYQADEETKEVSIPCGPANANFELTELDIIPQQRSRGYWKHQVSHVIKNIEHGDDKPTDYSAEDFMEFLLLTQSHFVLNQINPVAIYDGSNSGSMLDSLKLLKELLCAKKYNDEDIPKKLRKGKAELMALILNVVSGKISQTEVISEDGANVSQAITYSWMLLNDEITCTDEEDEDDDDADEDECNCNYKKAEKILKKINHGKMVKPNVIPLDIQFIAYKQGLTPNSYSLYQNYPNPFNPVTEISFSLPEASDVVLEIYNIRGQKVRTMVDDYFDAGNHTLTWDASNFASGIYLYKIEAGDFVETRKMILLK